MDGQNPVRDQSRLPVSGLDASNDENSRTKIQNVRGDSSASSRCTSSGRSRSSNAAASSSAGLARAKAQGKRLGRQPYVITDAQFEAVADRSLRDAAQALGVSRSVVPSVAAVT